MSRRHSITILHTPAPPLTPPALPASLASCRRHQRHIGITSDTDGGPHPATVVSITRHSITIPRPPPPPLHPQRHQPHVGVTTMVSPASCHVGITSVMSVLVTLTAGPVVSITASASRRHDSPPPTTSAQRYEGLVSLTQHFAKSTKILNATFLNY